ncbi:hypothetical protein GH714_026206 [Hevea brasiliensis]|uniref:Lon protease homolog n=1 Tax=Hevea brasiliensis TaxID=3981 RepID=A0A6A6M3V6_HEVBR|nr:hypothetical protein GH714_026206 [Hevea brasiliensis]
MLKLLSSSSVRQIHNHLASPCVRVTTESSTNPLLKALGSIIGLTRAKSGNPSFYERAFFSSDSSSDGKGEVVEVELKKGESGTDSADASNAIVPTSPRPEDYLTVLALPLPLDLCFLFLHANLCQGIAGSFICRCEVHWDFASRVDISCNIIGVQDLNFCKLDPKLLAALQESRKRQAPYAGAFLLKDKPGTDPNMVTGSEITTIQGDQVILIGHRRLRITEMVREDPLTVKVDHLKEKPYNKDDVIKATSFEVISTLRDVLKTSSHWRDQVQTYTQHIGDFNFPRLADFGAAISGASKLQCQEVLEELDVYKRLKLTLELVKKEVEISKIQELGLETDDKTALSAKFRERLEPNKEKIPADVLQVIEEELTKLQLLEASSSEFNVTRNYLDWLTALPWGNYSDENFDVLRAQKILDEDHYGLTDVKERILEFIAVGKLRGISQGASSTYIGAMPGKMVQCLKTVGTANPLVLIDEIDKLGRGHGGDPASALLELLDPEQNANFLDHYLDVPIDLSKVLFVCTANVVDMIPNPLLDRMEVIAIAGYISDEKMHIARDYLEKSTREACGIKPEQVEVTDEALLALIENYCREAGVRNLQKHIEKIYRKIALKLVREGEESESDVSGEPKEAKAESVQTSSESIDDGSSEKNNETSTDQPSDQIQGPVDQPVDSKEATETQKIEESEVTRAVKKVLVDTSNLTDFVGKPVFHAERIYEQTPVGVVMGLAWTAMGGSTLYIETTQVEQGEGKGALHLTGQLGDVMKESAQIAYTVARAILVEKEPDNPFFANSKLHLHVPAGATPKDGPSAGCTMITSLLSLAMRNPVRKDLAMTGEVTLTGKILPIGGVKEKTIVARSEVKTIIFPSANRRDFDELAPDVKKGVDVHFVDNYSQVFDLAFGYDQNGVNEHC